MAIFTNQAQLTYNGRTILSNIAQGEIAEAYTLTKASLGDSYTVGDTKTYVLTLQNTSGIPLTDVTITDNLGAFAQGAQTLRPLTYAGPIVTFINGVESAPVTPTTTTPNLTFSLPSVPAGGNAVVVYNTTVNNLAPLTVGSTITNTATASGGGILNPISSDDVITVTDEPLLGVQKSVSPTNVTDGVVTYTITIENYGNTESTDAVLSDTFDPVLSNIAVTLNGTEFTADNYTYSDTTGVFTTNANAITVPAATYTTAPDGSVTVNPGTTVITVRGSII